MARSSLILRSYRLLARAAEPFAVPALRLLARRDGKIRARLGERIDPLRAAGPLVWMHGASVGETLSLVPLIAALRRQRPDASVLVTSLTASSQQILEERLSPRVHRCYAPLDLPGCVSRFLKEWKPDLLVLAEAEIWPSLIRETHARGIPMALVNARFSSRSLRRWMRVRRTARILFGAFSVVLARDEATASHLLELGAQPESVSISGSLKAASEPLAADEAELCELRAAIGARPLWLAASTHAADEEHVLAAHERVRETHPDTLLVLVPRHAGQGARIAARIAGRGMICGRRSAGLRPEAEQAVHVADTFGELGLWYRIADAAFLGGSFGGVGGHNPFEPIAFDTVVLHGPDVANFADIYRALDSGEAAIRIRDGASLAEALLALFDSTGRATGRLRATAARARAIAAEAVPPDGADRIAARLLPLLPRVNGSWATRFPPPPRGSR